MSTYSAVKDLSSLAIGGGKPVREQWLPYGRQSISDEDVESVVKVLKSDWLTQGPNIGEFEESLNKTLDVKYSVAVNSGTAALHAAYYAIGIGEGDEIIMPAMSFAATANAALYLGATPVFADINIENGNISCESVRRLVTAKTKAIVGVDFGGHPCDLVELGALAREVGVPLIVDGAHSLGAKYNGASAAKYADLTTSSFHPVKIITTGEGGVIFTDKEEYANKMKRFRTHGIDKNAANFKNENQGPWYHEMQELGFNYRITDLQAALGSSQLKHLTEFIAKRRAIVAKYREKISHLKNFKCLVEKDNVESAYHLFPILVNGVPAAERRKFVFEALQAENIGVQVHYIPIYEHPFYQDKMSGNKPNCPQTDEFYSRIISLPIFATMSDEDVDDVVAALKKIDVLL